MPASLRDYVSHAGCDQQQGIAVIVAAHQRDGFPLKTTYLAVRQDGFQAVADFNARPPIADGIENQNPAIGGLLPDAPLFQPGRPREVSMSEPSRVLMVTTAIWACAFWSICWQISSISAWVLGFKTCAKSLT